MILLIENKRSGPTGRLVFLPVVKGSLGIVLQLSETGDRGGNVKIDINDFLQIEKAAGFSRSELFRLGMALLFIIGITV